MSDSLWPHGLWPTRLLRPWDFPGRNPGGGCHFLFQGIFPTQGQTQSLASLSLAGRFFTPGKKGYLGSPTQMYCLTILEVRKGPSLSWDQGTGRQACFLLGVPGENSCLCFFQLLEAVSLAFAPALSFSAVPSNLSFSLSHWKDKLLGHSLGQD